MITAATIDKIFEAARVEEVISEFVMLKKSGSNFKGLSPFSDERTPSFMVSPVKQIWKDFSSGKGGNAVSFLMEHEHFTYPEALRWLARKYNIEIEETQSDQEQKEASDDRESMYIVSNFAKDYFHQNLLDNEEGKAIGLTYFKERGFREETIRKFQLGYSLNEWNAFTETALAKGYELKYLEKTGLSIVKDDKNIDRFKARVMFPIHSMSGRVLGFGGRILTTTEKTAKYLNSPASEIYDKSKVLYGIYFAKQAIAKENNCYLVEGYTDVISLHQAGIENVVASSGTALTVEQIRLIKRLTPNITILYDGDAAGIKASFRGIDLILEQDVNVKVLTFPDNDDPDSYARKVSSDELKHYLTHNANDFIRFKIGILQEDAQNDPIKKAELVRDIVNSIALIPNDIQREIYVQETSHLLDISEQVLQNSLAQQIISLKKQATEQRIAEPAKLEVVAEEHKDFAKINELQKYEREIIKTLLIFGNDKAEFTDWVRETNDLGKTEIKKINYENVVAQEIYLHLQEDEIEFTQDLFREIYSFIIEQYNLHQHIDVKQLTQHQNQQFATFASDLLMEEDKYVLGKWESREITVLPKETHNPKQVSYVILNLRRILVNEKIKSIQEDIKNTTASTKDLMEEIANYNKLRMLLYEKLNRVV